MSARRSTNPPIVDVRLDAIAANLCRLFDFLPSVQFWIKDRAGCYRWVNRGFLLNYSLERPEDVLGKTDYDLSPLHLAEQFRADDELVLSGKPVLGRVELVGRFDHTAGWSVTDKLPLADAQQRIIATMGITRPLQDEAVEGLYPNVALGEVIHCIRQHYAEPLTNQRLARVAGLSVRGLERAFHQAFRASPQQYLRRVRVRMACYALVHTQRRISEIAVAHGFCDQSHFSREFRRQVGLSPQEYRRRYHVGAV